MTKCTAIIRTIVCLALPASIPVGVAHADDFVASAEFGCNSIRLFVSPLSYEVISDGLVLVPRTPIGLSLDEKSITKDATLVSTSSFTVKSSILVSCYKKSAVDLSRAETVADFSDFAVRLAARLDGVAYRIELRRTGAVSDEQADVTIPANARCWFNRTPISSLGCEETMPEFADASALPSDADKAFYLPFVYCSEGKTVAVTESGVHEYPAWNFSRPELRGSAVRLKSVFARYPRKTVRATNDPRDGSHVGVPGGGRWLDVVESEKYIARISRPRTLPWRVFVIGNEPSRLCEADIVYSLAEPAAKDADFSWVKPGKVAWDWWNAFDNKGDPEGCTTETYVRFIDFAAKNGVEYVIFDEGWSARLNIWEFSPVVDVPYLVDYAKMKGVGIILWMAWAQIVGEEAKVAEHFAKLGVKGFKVDFIDRADAEATAFLEKFASACAKNRMIVDYHGVYRPVGLSRKYPNILNYEGIHGLETMKWASADKDMGRNDVSCFFLRMTAGPMDYTPGAMDNYAIGSYAGNNVNPGSVGTRCHQMALMALYEAPLQMLSDSPAKYEKNMECFSFMAKTPVEWSETIGLGGCPETFAAVARKAKDGAWFVAGITNSEEREFAFNTKFLGSGNWVAEIFRDVCSINAKPAEYIHETLNVYAGDVMSIKMASGGGFVIRFLSQSERSLACGGK